MCVCVCVCVCMCLCAYVRVNATNKDMPSQRWVEDSKVGYNIAKRRDLSSTPRGHHDNQHNTMIINTISLIINTISMIINTISLARVGTGYNSYSPELPRATGSRPNPGDSLKISIFFKTSTYAAKCRPKAYLRRNQNRCR